MEKKNIVLDTIIELSNQVSIAIDGINYAYDLTECAEDNAKLCMDNEEYEAYKILCRIDETLSILENKLTK